MFEDCILPCKVPPANRLPGLDGNMRGRIAKWQNSHSGKWHATNAVRVTAKPTGIYCNDKGRLGSARPLSMSFRCLSFLVFKTEVQRKSIASIGTIQADPSACSCHSLGKPPLSGLDRKSTRLNSSH